MKTLGFIFAGGFGKRLLPITEKIPKPLIEISKNYTIMDKQLLDFKYAGIKEIYLLVGYMNEKIKERYGTKWNGLEINYIVEEEPKGTYLALKNAIEEVMKSHKEFDILLRNGDIVTDINIKNLMRAAEKSNSLMLLVGTKMQSPYGVLELEGRKIIGFKEKPVLNLYINAGIYYIKNASFEYFLRDYEKKEIEETVFPLLSEDEKIEMYSEEGVLWLSIDGFKDLEKVRDLYVNREDKPWGYEKTIVNNEKYLVKELYIKKDFSTSLHYHPRKDESMHVLSGEGYIDFGEEKRKEILKTGKVVRITPNTKHTIVATENLKIYEYSTPHPDDTVRVKDFYER